MNNDLMGDLEDCLELIHCTDEWTEDHDRMLERFRAARGELGMTEWQWWAREAGEESYANELPTKDAAIAWARREYGAAATIEVLEARVWLDGIEGEDGCHFAAWRNHEKIVGLHVVGECDV